MVGAVAFLAGVCRMTISLCVIMFEVGLLVSCSIILLKKILAHW